MNIEFAFPTIDLRVSAINILAQMKFDDYMKLANDVLLKNRYQRKQLRRKDRRYEMLRDDLLDGCVMPAIFLSTTEKFAETLIEKTDKKRKEVIDGWMVNPKELDVSLVKKWAREAIEKRQVIILDGVQRTYALESALESKDTKKVESLKKQNLRIEFYIGLTQTGILYRMLTLNTAQSPMSLRHQLEIVFMDFFEQCLRSNDIQVLREVDRARIDKVGKYRFSDVIGLYHAYLTKNPASMDRETVLEQLSQLEFMEDYDNKREEDLRSLLFIYDSFMRLLDEAAPSWKLDSSVDLDRPFGKSVLRLFSRSQPMAGFGAASKIAIMNKIFTNLSSLKEALGNLSFTRAEASQGLTELNVSMDAITKAGYYSKIGILQRRFFKVYFEHVISEWVEGSVNLKKCAIDSLEIVLEKKGA